MVGTVLAFLGPLIGEAVSLVGKFISANQEEQAKLIVQRDAAIAEMRGARSDEERNHVARMAEARAKLATP